MMRAHHIFMVRDIFIRQDFHLPYAMRVQITLYRKQRHVILSNIFRTFDNIYFVEIN